MCRLARQETGQSQVALSKAAEVPAYIVKQWEAGRLHPPAMQLDKLYAYFAGEGVDLDAIAAHVSGTHAAALSADHSAHAVPQEGFTFTPRPGFFISEQVEPPLVDSLMERMGMNDDRIAELTAESVKTGFFGDISDETEAKARELLGTLAENHIIFRFLQGRNIVSTSRDEPRTIGDFLGQMLKDSPVLPLIASDAAPTGGKPAAKAKAEPVTVEDEE